jgi:hypothetical protein
MIRSIPSIASNAFSGPNQVNGKLEDAKYGFSLAFVPSLRVSIDLMQYLNRHDVLKPLVILLDLGELYRTFGS